MKKYLFMAASAALVMSSCSSDELVQETPATDGQVAVAFDAPYLTSRATDVLNNEVATGLPKRGFGVFAYDQDNKSFSAYYPTALEPNFMKDQKVEGTGTHPNVSWTYSPVKYYNNNVGAKHSFFAYAPYTIVDKDNASQYNKVLDGNYPASLVLQGVNNGPAIHYVMPEDLANAVDLCWGEYNNTGRAAIDLEKPGVEQKLNFTFHHALSRVSFNAQLWVNEVRPEKPHGDAPAGEDKPTSDADHKLDATKTKVTIKSLKLVGTMATEGTLRLYDGVWDAQVATSQSLEMGDYFTGGGASPVVKGEYQMLTADDKIQKEQPLFGDDANYLMLLPGGSFQIEITYDVETLDPSLPGGKSVVTNTITSDEIYSLAAGQTYQFHLNLGLTSVKFDAEIKAWDEETDDIHEIDVPENHHEVVNAYENTGITDKPVALSNFDGVFNVAPVATAADHYYYNAEEGKMFKSAGTDPVAWSAYPTAGAYLMGGNLYIVTGSAGATTAMTAPRWIYDGSTSYYLYEDGAYSDAKTVTDTYSTDKAGFLKATSLTAGLYLVEGVIYYVK